MPMFYSICLCIGEILDQLQETFTEGASVSGF